MSWKPWWPIAWVAAAWSWTGCLHTAAPTALPPPAAGIRVVGEGEVLVQPNIASIRLGVESRAATAPEAMQAANHTMSAITSAVRKHGVAPTDIQTAELNVHFERDHRFEPEPPPPSPPEQLEPSAAAGGEPSVQLRVREPSGWFVVRNTLVLTLRDIDQLGAILGDAMEAGANNIHGLQMTLDDPQGARSQARRKAMEAARREAEEIASAAGVRLGRVLEVVEAGAQSAPVSERMQSFASARLSDVPIESGQVQISTSLQVLFAIEH